MKSYASLFVAFLSMTASAGCSSPIEPTTQGDTEALSTAPAPAGSSVDLAHPSGAYSVHITAAGTGCPKGAWAASLDDGGESIVVTYDDYVASADSTTPKAFEDCVLTMDLGTAVPTSFAIRGFSFDGRADVDGESWKTDVGVTLDNWFQGNGVPGTGILPRGVQLETPYHDAFDYDEDTLDADLWWSPCTKSPRLNVRSRFSAFVMPSTPGLAAAFGVRKMKWKLSWRTC
jgi:hypothetical protein